MPALEDYDISALSPLERKVLIIAATKLENLRFYPPNTNFNFTFTFQDGVRIYNLFDISLTMGCSTEYGHSSYYGCIVREFAAH